MHLPYYLVGLVGHILGNFFGHSHHSRTILSSDISPLSINISLAVSSPTSAISPTQKHVPRHGSSITSQPAPVLRLSVPALPGRRKKWALASKDLVDRIRNRGSCGREFDSNCCIASTRWMNEGPGSSLRKDIICCAGVTKLKNNDTR